MDAFVLDHVRLSDLNKSEFNGGYGVRLHREILVEVQTRDGNRAARIDGGSYVQLLQGRQAVKKFIWWKHEPEVGAATAGNIVWWNGTRGLRNADSGAGEIERVSRKCSQDALDPGARRQRHRHFGYTRGTGDGVEGYAVQFELHRPVRQRHVGIRIQQRRMNDERRAVCLARRRHEKECGGPPIYRVT